MARKKKKSFFKKAKVKLSTSQMILLTAIIAAVCIAMLFFSVLFSGTKKAPEAVKPSAKPAVEKSAEVSKPENQKNEKADLNKEPKTEKKTENKTEQKIEHKTEPAVTKSEPAVQKAPLAAESDKTEKTNQNAVPVSQAAKKNQQKKTASEVLENPYVTGAKKENAVTETVKKAPASAPAPQVQKSDVLIPQAKNNALLVFVFDDGGQNVSQLKKYLELPFAVSIAVLPELAHSVECARLVRSSKHQLMLHQPMQALNRSVNPGPGAITPEMDARSVRNQIAQNIAQIGPVAGFNNHEGSLILENKVQVEAILEEAANQHVFFLDSKTSAASQAKQTALEMGISIYSRDVFLDNEKTRKNVISELLKGLEIANRKGQCIMIGHVWSADLIPAILTELYPELVQKGYRFGVVTQANFD